MEAIVNLPLSHLKDKTKKHKSVNHYQQQTIQNNKHSFKPHNQNKP